MKVKEFVHNCSGIKSNVHVEFCVELVGKPIEGKPNVFTDWYNECPYMFDDADIMSWAVSNENNKIVIRIKAYQSN